MTAPTPDPFKARLPRERLIFNGWRDFTTTSFVTLLMSLWVGGLVAFGFLLGRIF